MVEFVNRMFTGLVSIAVIIAVLGSFLREPRRRDLVWLSLGLVAGVFAQAVLGGLTVLFELQPPFVMAHFLVSLVLLANALVLYRRAGQPDAPATLVTVGRRAHDGSAAAVGGGARRRHRHRGDRDRSARRRRGRAPVRLRHPGRGPHPRLERGPRSSRSCSLTLWLLRRTRAPRDVQQRLGVLLLVTLAQAGIGYAQYLTGIPALLVGFHLAGATAVWAAVIWFYLGLFGRDVSVPGAAETPRRPALASA